uniref:Uncharacterized protein n=1 Tax=Caenorhabditis japonica TaxID=281687 RepID=A0A8R1IQQ9_CAEJA
MDECQIEQALMTDDGLIAEFQERHLQRPKTAGRKREQHIWKKFKREVSHVEGSRREPSKGADLPRAPGNQ